MTTVQPSINQKQYLEMLQQIGYWKNLHERAKRKAEFQQKEAERFEKTANIQKKEIEKKEKQIEALVHKLAFLQKQLFGRKTEQTDKTGKSNLNNNDQTPADSSGEEKKRERGKQEGTEGHGRKIRENLPAKEIHHDFPEEDQFCPNCGKPFIAFPGTEDSEEIDWEVILQRLIHKRKRYKPSCNCGIVPGIISAPLPPKLIPKGMLSKEFIVRLLMEKFQFGTSVYRIRKKLELEGFTVSGGTLTGNMKRMEELLMPLYALILERNRSARHWHMDETRWKVFEEIEGKKGYRWWLWVMVTHDTCVYVLDPSRSAEVPKAHLGENSVGVISADRYVVYKTLGDGISVAFCWSHVRRDFIRIRDGNKRLKTWGTMWVEDINNLFKMNRERLEVRGDPKVFKEKDQKLQEALLKMEQKCNEELLDEELHKLKRKVLRSLRNHWEGLTIFVHQPEIPMDNNEAERCLRNPVIGRKNYYGSGAVWSGTVTQMMFTIFQTLLLNKINPRLFLLSYFDECARNKGSIPAEPERFLPWNLSEEQKASLTLS